jgi:hypothetical protein
MGCGASQQVAPLDESNNNGKQNPGKQKQSPAKEIKVTGKPPVGPGEKFYSLQTKSCMNGLIFFSVPKPVSFEIGLQNNNGLDIISKHPPKRLQVDPSFHV